jgi:DNA invertase Pin-like site-specific DNA recombinase
MKKAIIYTRVALADGGSVTRQKSMCQKYCDENDIEVVGVYTDDGASGLELFRTGLYEAIEHSRTEKVDLLLVSDKARLARDISLYMDIQKTLHRHGVKIVVPASDPLDSLLEEVFTAMQRYERYIRLRRCAMAQKTLREQT